MIRVQGVVNLLGGRQGTTWDSCFEVRAGQELAVLSRIECFDEGREPDEKDVPVWEGTVWGKAGLPFRKLRSVYDDVPNKQGETTKKETTKDRKGKGF